MTRVSLCNLTRDNPFSHIFKFLRYFFHHCLLFRRVIHSCDIVFPIFKTFNLYLESFSVIIVLAVDVNGLNKNPLINQLSLKQIVTILGNINP